jgi:hypothetical protein
LKRSRKENNHGWLPEHFCFDYKTVQTRRADQIFLKAAQGTKGTSSTADNIFGSQTSRAVENADWSRETDMADFPPTFWVARERAVIAVSVVNFGNEPVISSRADKQSAADMLKAWERQTNISCKITVFGNKPVILSRKNREGAPNIYHRSEDFWSSQSDPEYICAELDRRNIEWPLGSFSSEVGIYVVYRERIWAEQKMRRGGHVLHRHVFENSFFFEVEIYMYCTEKRFEQSRAEQQTSLSSQSFL